MAKLRLDYDTVFRDAMLRFWLEIPFTTSYNLVSFMPRGPRAEVEGGLYHIIARGNHRQDIFHSQEDHKRFLSLLASAKERSPHYLYAYCLMTNHFHLAIERQKDAVGRIMQRVLTGYSQYYNRKYRKSGHLFQGRHKAILCQSDRYLGELVRYIHLNPVRAKMVRKAERYPYSSQRAYLGIEPQGIVDVDPVLRLFGARKQKARENFAEFVAAGAKLGHQDQFYSASEGCILGSEEFVDATIHRVWERDRKSGLSTRNNSREFEAERLLAAVEQVLGVSQISSFASGKSSEIVRAKEILIVAGRRSGASGRVLSEITGLDPSNITRRHDAATKRLEEDNDLADLVAKVINAYKTLK
jgi:REP element-mobilizing transposase RayT